MNADAVGLPLPYMTLCKMPVVDCRYNLCDGNLVQYLGTSLVFFFFVAVTVHKRLCIVYATFNDVRSSEDICE